MTDVFKIVNWLRVTSNAEMRTYDAEELTQMKVMKLHTNVGHTIQKAHASMVKLLSMARFTGLS